MNDPAPVSERPRYSIVVGFRTTGQSTRVKRFSGGVARRGSFRPARGQSPRCSTQVWAMSFALPQAGGSGSRARGVYLPYRATRGKAGTQSAPPGRYRVRPPRRGGEDGGRRQPRLAWNNEGQGLARRLAAGKELRATLITATDPRPGLASGRHLSRLRRSRFGKVPGITYVF